MAILLTGTTIGGHSAIHAGNLATHGIVTTSNIGSYALTSLPSHNHDDRYYTESESDSRYLSINGGTVTGWALFTASTQGTAIVRATQQDTSAGYYLFQGITGSSEVFRVERSGRLNSAEYIYSYGYRGNGNVGGTGSASWHPDGAYIGSTMWQYGAQYKNNTGIYDVSEFKLNAGPTLSIYNSRNLSVRALDNNADVGILGQQSGGGFAFQIYGTGSSYGFLNGIWAAWDIRKAVNGAMYMNDNDSYYLQTNSTSNFVALNIQGNAVVHAGNIGSQSVSNSNHLNSTRDTPSGKLQYWDAPGLGIDEAPSGDWHNTIRMGHGSPLSYYSNTLAIRMTGSGVGDIYTQTIMNGNRQGWKKHWNDGNHGSGSGLDADLLDGQQGSYYQPASSAITTSNIGSQSVNFANSSTSAAYLNYTGVGGTQLNANTFSYGRASNYYSTAQILNSPENAYASLYNFGGDTPSALSLQLFASVNHNDTSSTRNLWFRVGNNLGFQNDWKQIIHSGSIGSQSVSYATTAGALSSMNISQFTNNSGYITGYTETDTLNSVTGRGNTTSNSVRFGNHVDLSPTGSAFRFYDGSTFRGGFGLDSWGHAGSDANLVLYVNGDNTLFFSTSGTKRAYINSASFYSFVAIKENGNQVLHAGNYTSYSPSLTGSGASGTWGINVTGTAARATRANGNFYIDDNYGNTIVGLYNSTILQGVFAMGDAYKLTAGGGAGNLYGLAWSHPNAGGVASNLNTHGLLVMENGTFLAAISGSIRARDDMRAPIFYDSNDTTYYLDPNSNSYLSTLRVANATSGVSLHVGLGSTHGVYTADNDRKYLVVSATYYPHMALVATSSNNSNHGAVFSFVGSESGAARQWNMGIANSNPFVFSIGYNRTGDNNPHYGIGDGWHGDDNHHARLSIDRDGNTKIRGMLYINGTSGGISTGSAVIHAGNIGSQSVSYASTAGALSSMNISQFSNNSGYFVSSTANTVSVNQIAFSTTNYDFTLAPRLSIGSMSIKLWDNYFNSSGLGVDYGSLLDIYGRGGHVHSQFYMDAGGGLFYRMSPYASGWTSWASIWTSSSLTNLNQLTNGPGYITSSALSGYATQSYVNSQGFLTSVPAQSQLISPNGATVVAADSAMPNAGHSFIHSLALGPGGNDGHILGMSWAGTTSVYGAQIFLDTDPNDIMAIRSRSNAGVWTSWKTVYHNGNFTDNSSNWNTAYSWGNHASAGYLTSLPSHNHDDRYYTETESDGRFQPLENQRLSTGNSPTFANVYASEWFRNYGNQGIYNQTYGTHFYSLSSGAWAITGSGGAVEIQFRSNHQSTLRGYVYADTSNNIGFLNNAGNWSLRTDSSRDTQIYGALTVGSGTSADIYMTDTDETTRRIHTNSGRIGFLNSSSNWGAYCDNTGNWFSDHSMRAPIFYDSQDTNYYVDPNSLSRLGTMQIDRIGVGQAVDNGYRIITSGDIYLNANGNGWAEGVWKQRRGGSTYYDVIDSGNIGSQSVNYAATAGSAPANGGNSSTVGGFGAGSFFRDLGFEGGGANANTIAETRSAFTYSSGSPWTGPLAYFGASGYGLQLNATYQSGVNISYRTRNGDNATWNSWREFIHSGNIGSQSVSYASTAGTANAVAWTNVSSRPTALSQFSNDLGNYGGFLTSLPAHDHDRLFLTDSRGASRAPSYYDQRYAQWDFQNTSDTGAGGDGWHGLLTVAKWSSYDPSHRQEQLAFTGDELKRRTATSDSAWGSWKTIIDSGNIGSQSVSNAATVGGYTPSGSVGANTVVIRDANNYIYAHYINSNVSESENPTINSFYTSNGDGWLRKSSVAHVKSQLGLGSLAYLSSLNELDWYGYLTSENWNTYWTSNKLRVASVSGATGTGRPPTSVHNFGSLLSYGTSSGDAFQMYFPDNAGNSIANSRKLHYRTGQSVSAGPTGSGWCDWRTVVDMVGDTLTIVEGATPKIVVRGSTGYGNPSSGSIELVGDADGGNTQSYRWISTAPDWGGQEFRLERKVNNAFQLVGRVPKNTNNLEWQGTIVQGLSDSRVKTNVVSMTEGLDKIDRIRPVTFDWVPTENVSDREGADFGFIAQELEEVLPEVVHTRGDGYKTVMYEKVVPVLVQAMKEQQAIIEALKAEIELLKNK
jgi:hypothetical protein